MAPARALENVYSRLEDNQLLLTNFPTTQQISESWVMDLIQKHEPSLLVEKIQLTPTYLEDGRVSHAIISFESKGSVQVMKRALRKLWIDNRMLKMKTKADKFTEEFKNRTIIVTGFPNHVKDLELAEHFSQFGAVTHLEVPSQDAYIKAELERKGLLGDYFNQLKQKKHEEEYRLAL